MTEPGGRRLGAGIAWALLAISLWGGWFVVTRRTVGAGGILGPADLVALRFGIGGLLLLPVLVLRLRGLDRSAWRDGLILFVAQGAPFALLISVALRHAPAGHGAALTPGTMPLFAALLGILVLGDRPGRAALAGFGLIAAGALTLAGGFRDSDELFGYALSRLAEAPLGELAIQAVYQGVLVSVVALIAFNRSLALIGRRTPGFTALVPVIATILAIPVLGEVPSPVHVGAILAIGAGVLLTTRG